MRSALLCVGRKSSPNTDRSRLGYEVSRSLAACEGVILLVDASQGIEAQTLANCYQAIEHDLTIVAALNKIDLPAAEPDKRAQEIERVLGRALVQPPHEAENTTGQPLAPGMLASHYAPRTPVRLNAGHIEAGEALLAFGTPAVPGVDAATVVMNLSASGDLTEAAANLFGYLRALDLRGARSIAVMPVPDHGLGEAINDRLRRAAMGRE